MTDVRDACYARVMDTFPTSSAEWQTRVDLAACYQLCALYGWDDGIYTHISATVPGEPGHYLINPFGMRFDEVKASNLVKVDSDGNPVGPMRAPESVDILIHEIKREHWATGGKLWSDA
jgi:ribulose-5-phosphate 4-epimerase/fuculose-1-phosphate aldolase